VIVVSDFYDAEEETRRALRRVAQRGHDVAMLQLLSPDELALPYTGNVEVEDLESGQRRWVDAAAASAAYADAMNGFLERCRSQALREGIDYALFRTDVAPQIALRDYLIRRGRRYSSGHAPRAASR
jgi:hypothetical protein